MSLPLPDSDAQAHSALVYQAIRQEIAAAGGWISFARYMELALYAPGLGYYAAGARKFGAAGDFVTAPELSPLFGRALARPVAAVMAATTPAVIEVGAGTGRLAADLLLELEALGQLPTHYAILDLSGDLRQRQAQTLADAVPHLLPRVQWLDRLPTTFSGVVVGNELLDALPVEVVAWRADGIFSRGVGAGPDGLIWVERPAAGPLHDTATTLGDRYSLPPGFESEIGLAARGWAAEWGRILGRGALLLLDYGFPQREFYHPQRGRGTLMCHYRHHAHTDPFLWPGLQDITAHVDFTAIAAAAHGAGLDLLGYSSQSQFLLNCGILDLLGELPTGSPAYVRATAAVSQLLMPHEMGELFKVMALGRGLEGSLPGFQQGDRRHRL